MPIAASSERRSTTLGGCRIEREGDGPVYVWREMGRDGPSELDLQPGMQRIWDGRFRVGLAAEAAAPVLVRALGADGLRGIGREMLPPDPVCGKSAPPGAAETMPSFWRNGRLLAVPGLLWPIGPPSGCWASFVAEDTLDAGG